MGPGLEWRRAVTPGTGSHLCPATETQAVSEPEQPNSWGRAWSGGGRSPDRQTCVRHGPDPGRELEQPNSWGRI